MFEPCPCGGGRTYLACCARLHDGRAEAASPEALMRARYSAFALRNAAYLLKTWAAETRPTSLGRLDDRDWLGLTIEHAPPPSDHAGEAVGVVRFAARWRDPATASKGVLRETSRFRREHGLWLYVDGEVA